MEGQGEKAMKYATLLEKGLWHTLCTGVFQWILQNSQ